MRAIYSYGAAGVIIVVVAVWLGTGTFVQGGNGPGNGERPIVSFIEKDGGPLTASLEEAGVLAHPEHAEGSVDPHLTIAQRVAETSGEAAPLQSVRTRTFTIQPMPIEAPLRGRTQAKASVTITPETSGTVQQVHVEKGQAVAAGDLICTLDQGTRASSVAQAEAALAQAQTDFDTNAALREKGLAPANSASQYEVALKAAQTALENAMREWNNIEVRTDVAGIVQDPLATAGSMLSPGQPCATVVELDPMLFIGTVPEARIGLAKTGLPAEITTVTGETFKGEVTFIASVADEATRSFPVEIEIPNPDGRVRSGLTAEALVSLGTAPAHLLPQSVLTLDDDGRLGVRTVENGVVAFYPVTIISDTREGVWVSGLPARADVITVGQEFVVVGQPVEATNVSEEQSASEPAPAEGVAS